jgi:putative transposase
MMIFEKHSRVRSNFKGHVFWARGYYVNTIGLDEQKIRQYMLPFTVKKSRAKES